MSPTEDAKMTFFVAVAAEWMRGEGFENPYVQPYIGLVAFALAMLDEFKTYEIVNDAVYRYNKESLCRADAERCPDWFVDDVLRFIKILSRGDRSGVAR